MLYGYVSLIWVVCLLFRFHTQDYSRNNPLTNPPPTATFRTYSPINSTDATIKAAAEYIVATYSDWDGLPALNTVQQLNGEAYWLASDTISTSVPDKINICHPMDGT